MADYQQMYLTIFRKVTKAITLLQEAQIESEEIFVLSDDVALKMLSHDLDDIPASDDGDQ